MYQLTTEHSFDSAHFLAGYQGKCRNLHGHRWRVVLTVESEDLQDDLQQRGMCVDFSDLKQDLKESVDCFDHALIIEENSLRKSTVEALEEEGFLLISVPFRPTAENFAKYFYQMFEKKGYQVALVQVFETPNNCASYHQ